jgi:hypothetical protein
MHDGRMIQVKVNQLFLSNVGFVVLLKNEKEERSLPIFIGAAEAQAIAIHINQVSMPRPLTHDLMKNVLDYMECRLRRIEICDLKEGTFFARLVLDKDGTETSIDSRPSDAIALALRCDAPIYVDPKVMDEAGRVLAEGDSATPSIEAPSAPAEGGVVSEKKGRNVEPTPLDLLEKRLAKAVSDEHYEEAARLRDEIRKLKQTHTKN